MSNITILRRSIYSVDITDVDISGSPLYMHTTWFGTCSSAPRSLPSRRRSCSPRRVRRSWRSRGRARCRWWRAEDDGGVGRHVDAVVGQVRHAAVPVFKFWNVQIPTFLLVRIKILNVWLCALNARSKVREKGNVILVSQSYFDKGYLKMGGGVPIFRRRAIMTKLGTNIPETLPYAANRMKFSQKMQFYAKNFNFSEKGQVFKKSLFCLRATIWVGKRWLIFNVLHTVGKLQLSSFQQLPLELCATKGSVRRGQNARGGQKRYPEKLVSGQVFILCGNQKCVCNKKRIRRCLLQFSFCQLGPWKMNGFCTASMFVGPNFQNLIFWGKKIWTHAKTCSLHSNGCRICVKDL